MAENNQLTILPAPPRFAAGMPAEDYANQINRWLQNLYRYVVGVNYLRGNGLYLPGLPITGYGLRAGEVFANDGVLTIVRDGDIWLDTFAVEADAGSVTVTT